MRLPFTLEQFLDVFGSYNRSLWPIALLLWLATVAAAARLARDGARASNPAATLFGILFIAQALLFVRHGIARGRITYDTAPSARTRVAFALIAYVRTNDVRVLAVIPLFWCVVGGSAAFLFGVRADLMLVVAGLLLLAHVARPGQAPRSEVA